MNTPPTLDSDSAPEKRDLEEQFFRLWTRHESALRAYVRVCFPAPDQVDEIVQECAIVAWRKFGTLECEAHFDRWLCAIARYEVLMARRRLSRDRLVFSEEVLELFAQEAAEEMPLRRQQLEVLEACMAKLSQERRELALVAYAKRAAVPSIAQKLNRTEGAIYQMLARIRQDLLGCMQRALSHGGVQ